VWYETPLKALARWDAVRPHYDVMVVSDLLPMLTLQEFLSEAMVLVPEAVFCVATEPGVLVERVPNVQYVDKPLSAERLRSILLRGRTAAA
jgi:hypothetical protein